MSKAMGTGSCDVLLATDVRFWRKQMGSETRIAHMLDWLCGESIRVKVFFVGTLAPKDKVLLANLFPSISIIVADGEDGVVALGRKWSDRLVWENLISVARWRTCQVFAKMKGESTIPTLDAYFRPDTRRAVESMLRILKPKLFLVEYVRLAYLIPIRSRLTCHYVIDTHDIQSVRCESFSVNGERASLAISPTREQRALRLADHVLAIQNEEAEFLRREWRIPSVHLVPHASSIVSIPWRPSGQVLFVGSSVQPNVEAMMELLEMWPRLRARACRALELHIVGSVGLSTSRVPSSLQDVYIHGVVDELYPHYANAELVVNPVRFGSGLKIKCVEALCHGRPVLTTPIGAQGFDVSASQSGLVVSKPGREFLDELATLLSTPERLRELACHAVAYARSNFSPDAAYAPLKKLLAVAETPYAEQSGYD